MRSIKGFQKGVNLGGWISQFDKYDIKHFESFITKDDIAYIASLGFDHVRVPVDYNVLEDEEGNSIESGFEYLEKCREYCEEYKLNMLIDLHECYGYSFDPLKVGMDRRVFFYDEKLQERFLNLWRKIANRFKNHQDMVAFEPLNEVVLSEVKDAWNEVASKYIKMMRGIVPDAYLIIGGVEYNNVLSVPFLSVPIDDKIVYNFHCYEPFIFTHQGAYWVDGMPKDFRIGYPKTISEYQEATSTTGVDNSSAIFKEGIGKIGESFFDDIFAPAIEKATMDNVPLYCGEYGVIDLAEPEDALRWFVDIHAAFERYGIGCALWNYKQKDFGLVDKTFESIKDRFIKLVTKK